MGWAVWRWQNNAGGEYMDKVCIAVNICTFKRAEWIKQILDKLQVSSFFGGGSQNIYSGALYIFIVDNGCELQEIESEYVNLRHNPEGNTGGSGGFQYGIELIRRSQVDFTHVVFMDDDVQFELSCFYRLYEFLLNVNGEDADRPVAGRMFRMDRRDVQYTAGEIWNFGNVKHVGLDKTLSEIENEEEVDYHSGAEYGGWWFCCFPYDFVKENDIMPFFIHCDDVEYGLRCGRPPIIIKGVQVWHETFEYRQTPIMCYYDIRNPLFVNEKFRLNGDAMEVLSDWKRKISFYHAEQKWDYEYYAIKGMIDFLKGTKWLTKIHPGRYHDRLRKAKISRVKNSVMWRAAEYQFKKKYGV